MTAHIPPVPANAFPHALRARRAARLLARPLLVLPLAALALPQLAAPAAAQSAAPPAGRVETLDDVNVIANSTPTRNDRTGSSVSVITSEDLQNLQRRTLPDALQLAPGLNIVQSGGAGATASVFMRGTNSNHVKVFIDGIDVSDPSNSNGAVDFSKFLTSDIERIEILRGPQSGLYGSDAIGGVIAITTKRGQSGPDGRPKVSIYQEMGSRGTMTTSARVSGLFQNVDYAFNFVRDKGHQNVVPWTSIPLAQWGQPTFLPGNDNLNASGSGRIGVQVTDNFRVNAFLRYTNASLRYAVNDSQLWPIFSPVQALTNDRQIFGRIEGEWTALDGKLKSVFGVSAGQFRSFTDNPDSLIGLSAPAAWNNFGYVAPNLYKGWRTSYDWRSTFEFTPGHKIIAGFDRKNEWLEQPAFDWNNQVYSAGKNGNTGLYAEYVGAYFDRLFISANIRQDINDMFGQHTSWRVAPAFHVPGTETVLKASYGTGFKAPTLNQLYVSLPPWYYANPKLRPETSTGFDFGFEQPLFDNKLRVGASYYENEIKNLITYYTDPATFIGSLENIAKSRIRGVEAFAALEWSPQFSVRADYTYTHAKDVSPLTASSNLATEAVRRMLEGSAQPDLLRRPRHKFSLQATWKPIDKLTLSASLTRLSSGYDIDRNGLLSPYRLKAPGYTLVNLAAEYQALENVAVTARIDNLTNRKYENPIGYSGAGLSAHAGVRFEY